MGRKVFISYKYADQFVQNRWGIYNNTARTYVDFLQELIGKEHINLGEKDGEDLSNFKDSTIASRLRDKIWGSSVTIVLISKGMKDQRKHESDQWIPWEISYSLKEHKRGETVSRTNGVIAVVLPDEFGTYEYYISDKSCCTRRCKILKTERLFSILRHNMFNKFDKDEFHCVGQKLYIGFPSYIETVKWDDFILNPTGYIEMAITIRDRINQYNVRKVV